MLWYPASDTSEGSTFRRLALLAERAACMHFLDLIGRVVDLAIAHEVPGDLADLLARVQRELAERLHVTAHGDDEVVHHVLDARGLLVDRFRHAREELLDLGQVEV